MLRKRIKLIVTYMSGMSLAMISGKPKRLNMSQRYLIVETEIGDFRDVNFSPLGVRFD